MSDERNRVPLEPSYAQALGAAVYCFGSCEWNVVWCCEGLQRGALNKISRDKLTAGQIASMFTERVRNMPPSRSKLALRELAADFLDLVELRNSIVHGTPCTSPHGDQRIGHKGQIFEPTDLADAADAFTRCSMKANEFVHGELKVHR
ncbi:MAG: hypothetical protein EON54_01735 [Alcaligenaceae bacterium]|nr:MAG: hypothetical protein EON54_01735 [Alcaligenaceae bacterium]